MEINLVKLLDVFKERLECTISIDTRDTEPILSFTKGHHSMNGGTTIYRTFKDLYDILEVNNVFKRLNEISDDKKENRNYAQEEKEIDTAIYETLVKYILQMLSASLGRHIYVDIIPLERDKDYFWLQKA